MVRSGKQSRSELGLEQELTRTVGDRELIEEECVGDLGLKTRLIWVQMTPLDWESRSEVARSTRRERRRACEPRTKMSGLWTEERCQVCEPRRDDNRNWSWQIRWLTGRRTSVVSDYWRRGRSGKTPKNRWWRKQRRLVFWLKKLTLFGEFDLKEKTRTKPFWDLCSDTNSNTMRLKDWIVW